MNRAGHYKRAEELAEEAVQVIARAERIGQRRDARDDANLLLRRAMVHATLANAPRDVAEPALTITAPTPSDARPKPSPPIGARS